MCTVLFPICIGQSVNVCASSQCNTNFPAFIHGTDHVELANTRQPDVNFTLWIAIMRNTIHLSLGTSHRCDNNHQQSVFAHSSCHILQGTTEQGKNRLEYPKKVAGNHPSLFFQPSEKVLY